jgi:hypothetical protein
LTATRFFSQSSGRGEEEGTGPHHPRQHAQTNSGFTFPAFALFAAALPIGYYFSDSIPSGAFFSSQPSRPSEFVPYTLVAKEPVSSTCALFTLAPSQPRALDLYDPRLERAITSVEFKQPQLQIARSYTCLPQQDGQPVDALRFLIRREPKGEVSNFLHRLPTAAAVEVRGFRAEYVLPEHVASAVFVVGGTGIAPAMQAADILAGEADVHIVWASRRREDCIGGCNDTPSTTSSRWAFWPFSKTGGPVCAHDGDRPSIAEKGAIVSLLERLKERSSSPGDGAARLHVDYYVDEEGKAVKLEDVKRILHRLSHGGNEGRKLIFVSGPEGFVRYWAGPKHWEGGKEVQGPIRGVLSTLDLKEWEVIKL